MPRIKHILFPVDFSERSDGAAPFVAAMAAKYDAQVTLLTAAHANYAGGQISTEEVRKARAAKPAAAPAPQH